MADTALNIVESPEKSRKSLRPLARLWPYVARYKFQAAAAFAALVIAAVTTLALPTAVRRMIDHGFSVSDTAFIDNYFSMLVLIAAVLALASAARYYFVITLGERIVADIRRDVFAHLTTLSPAFFDRSNWSRASRLIRPRSSPPLVHPHRWRCATRSWASVH